MRDNSPAVVPHEVRSNVSLTIARLSLAIATVAMAALHVLQPALHPLDRPVSFYIHGDHGWLLPLSLGAFGLAAFTVSLVRPTAPSRGSACSLALFGIGMLMTALLPSDRWFPWENEPSVPGLIHATVAIIAPLLLLDPMLTDWRARRAAPVPNASSAASIITLFYVASLLGSGLSLAIGLLFDRSPPWIGLAERVLALAAVAWLGRAAWPRARTSPLQR